MRVYESRGPGETQELAGKLAAELVPGDILAFRGGLGAGKTAFTRGLAAGLGIDPDTVCSPTYSLLNVYLGGRVVLYHFDMYRVTGFDSLCSTGFFDYIDSGGITAVEWSENVAGELPAGSIFVAITPTGEHSRSIRVEGGARF